MMLPLLLAAMGGTSYVTSGQLQASAAQNGMNFKEHMGFQDTKLVGAAGLVSLLIGPPLIAAIGGGLLLGAFEAHRTVTTIRDGIAQVVAAKMQQQAGPQVPGAPTPPLLPGASPQEDGLWNLPGRLLDAILPSNQAAPA